VPTSAVRKYVRTPWSAQRARTLRYPHLLAIREVDHEGDTILCVTEEVAPLLALEGDRAPAADDAILGLHHIVVRSTGHAT